jgi:MRB1590 C-terminal domain/P-loop domain
VGNPQRLDNLSDWRIGASGVLLPVCRVLRFVADASFLVKKGEYFHVADTVIMMENYTPADVSADAKRIAEENPTDAFDEADGTFGLPTHRIPATLLSHVEDGRVKTLDMHQVQFGEQIVQLTYLEQLVEVGQTRSAAELLQGPARERFVTAGLPMSELLDGIERAIDARGLDALCSQRRGWLSRPRRVEFGQVLNRVRSLEARQVAQDSSMA